MWHLLKSGNCVFLTEQFYVFLPAVVALDAYFIFVTILTTHVAPSLFFSHFPPLHFWPRLCRKFQSRIFSAPYSALHLLSVVCIDLEANNV